ncbi:PA domain-containing protein [Elongatibacter sediminis]|uniref:PA domain-containing protein n=1 Tax=Elongatibacter sediminis TaxID=3119006 RepID=A0AAW9RGX5_9GAMM
MKAVTAGISTVLLSLGLSAFSPLLAATIVIQNNDGPGEGFNETDSPPNGNQVGNNPGANLGEMRVNVFNAAAQRWGQLLNSAITITIAAEFNDLFCSQNSAVLGQAAATGTAANFGAGAANVAYHIALAESLAGSNLNGGSTEITATFNSAVDSGNVNCLGGGGFYYGLDGNAPDGTTPLFVVVLHELAHGLGFSQLADVGPGGTGAFTGTGGFPDPFSRNLHDLETAKSWDTMTNGERLASAINDPDLVWEGSQVTAQRTAFLDPAPEVDINAPPGIVGTHPANLGEEPTIVLPMGGVTADVVDGDALVADPCADTSGAMSGRIVLYDLPAGCSAVFPAFLAEFSGAVGVIIANTSAGGLPDMSGQITNQDVTIPYVGVMQQVGADLRANIGSANATIGESDTVLSGENQGMLRMFAPSPFVMGSSVSHWASEARPDLLMESSRGDLGFNQVDLTLPAMNDIGWSVNIDLGEIFFMHGFEDP